MHEQQKNPGNVCFFLLANGDGPDMKLLPVSSRSE